MILCVYGSGIQTEEAFPSLSKWRRSTNCLANPNENWSLCVLQHILFYHSCIQSLPDYVHAFYECFRRAVAKLNILDK